MRQPFRAAALQLVEKVLAAEKLKKLWGKNSCFSPTPPLALLNAKMALPRRVAGAPPPHPPFLFYQKEAKINSLRKTFSTDCGGNGSFPPHSYSHRPPREATYGDIYPIKKLLIFDKNFIRIARKVLIFSFLFVNIALSLLTKPPFYSIIK